VLREPRIWCACAAAALLAGTQSYSVAADVTAAVACNPPVRVDVDGAPLSKTLAGLAEAHDFALVFPDSMERSVTLHDELALDAMLERLTTGISTSYLYADEADCTGHRIVKLVLYPIGEQGEPIRGAGGTARVPKVDRGYIYIEDMDSYARDVMLKKQRPELRRLTPEQRVEFRMSRRRLKQEMRAQGKDGELRKAQRAAKKGAAGSDKPAADSKTAAPSGAGAD